MGITVNFDNATLTSSNCALIVTGGAFGLQVSDALSISGTVSFSSLCVTTGAISFNIESGADFNASIEAPLIVNGGDSPELEVTNFSGIVTVTWPTANGLQTQTLESGNPITLSGYVD